MSNPINDGGPAFPTEVSGMACSKQVADDLFQFSGATPGMSLRDWFAGQALLTNECRNWPSVASAAEAAYNFADAMIKAREVKP